MVLFDDGDWKPRGVTEIQRGIEHDFSRNVLSNVDQGSHPPPTSSISSPYRSHRENPTNRCVQYTLSPAVIAPRSHHTAMLFGRCINDHQLVVMQHSVLGKDDAGVSTVVALDSGRRIGNPDAVRRVRRTREAGIDIEVLMNTLVQLICSSESNSYSADQSSSPINFPAFFELTDKRFLNNASLFMSLSSLSVCLIRPYAQ